MSDEPLAALPWKFATQNPLHKNREPIQGEFFSTESIDSVAESLVRYRGPTPPTGRSRVG